ncbi:hypothetical protein F0145_10895 [Adhaeribacter rhizoryzae]|uniref:Uncharacterized protein n=1 Tax=Adhaeribacter rhizoryzae TaxID=2607907 RepID=A0A5M6DGM3_9BACT|nr:hypothetical protein F0145_10895 [Adhaeribacter rhizoryzae]
MLLTGVLLRIQFYFFFPQQLAAFKENPVLLVTAYNFFVAGNILLWPAIITLAQLVGNKKRQLALWGGTFVIFGLFARTFHGGADHLAFQLVRVQGLELATKAIASSYGAFNIVATLNGAILLGWIILAVGAYLSGTLGLFRSVSLGLMAALMLGVLKGSSWVSVIATAGLCIALVPLGIKVLQSGPIPNLKAVIGWLLIVLTVVVVFYFLGQAG